MKFLYFYKERVRGKEGERGEGDRKHSLRMQLVQSPVHAHCYFESLQPTVFSDFVHHGSHACSTELSRPPGHHSAHLLDNDAIITGALEPQVVQDGTDLQQGQAVTGGRGESGRSADGLPPPGAQVLYQRCWRVGLGSW